MNRSDLSENWIRRYELIQQHGDAHPDADSFLVAVEELDNLIVSDPIVALDVLKNIYLRTKDSYVLENLGAGPLETLLVAKGSEIESALDELLLVHPSFGGSVLRHVWWDSVDQALKEKYAPFCEEG